MHLRKLNDHDKKKLLEIIYDPLIINESISN